MTFPKQVYFLEHMDPPLDTISTGFSHVTINYLLQNGLCSSVGYDFIFYSFLYF